MVNQQIKRLVKMKPTEDELCKQFCYQIECLLLYKQVQPFIMFHVPNEREFKKGKGYGHYNNLLAIGFKPGVSDYILMNGTKTVCIEFKRDKTCKLRPNQVIFKNRCESLGIPYMMTFDVDEALNFVKTHYTIET